MISSTFSTSVHQGDAGIPPQVGGGVAGAPPPHAPAPPPPLPYLATSLLRWVPRRKGGKRALQAVGVAVAVVIVLLVCIAAAIVPVWPSRRELLVAEEGRTGGGGNIGGSGEGSSGRRAPDCARSLAESGHLICEPLATWEARLAIHARQSRANIVTRTDASRSLAAWWQSNYEPTWSCALEERLGNPGDGGKWVCDPSAIQGAAAAAGKACVIYSVGSGGRAGFEKAMNDVLPRCAIHTFDHTVGADARGVLPPYVDFHPWGLAATDGAGAGGEPMRSLGSIRRELGHGPETTSIEILKVDIEGAEYSALLPWLRDGALEGVRQLLIELHGPSRSGSYATARRIFAELAAAGYVITHKEPNLMAGGGSLVEYVFLKLDLKQGGED